MIFFFLTTNKCDALIHFPWIIGTHNVIVTPDQKQLLKDLNGEKWVIVSDNKNDSDFTGNGVLVQQGNGAACRRDGTFCVCQT